MRRLLVLAMLGLTCAAVAQETARVGEDTRLLDCLVDASLPLEPARAAEGGYAFEYQSVRGLTEDGRVCTLYRLRNTPDKPPTPVRWTQGDEVLLDKMRLARCGAAVVTCPWANVVKYFEGHVDTNLSLLAYGLNADAYHQQVETFMNSLLPTAREAHSVGTELQGTFASEQGEPVEVHLIVKSRVEVAAAGERVAVLEITDLSGNGVLASDLLRVEWGALEVAEAAALLRAAPADDTVGIVVAGAGQGQAPPGGGVSRSAETFEVRFPVQAYALQRGFRLEVFYRDDAEPVISVEMPAFVPGPTPP